MAHALLLTLVLTQAYYTPDEAQSVFTQANDAYSREDYAAAEHGYQKLLQHGYGGPDVLFNLGTTYLAQGRLGEAVLHLERARRFGRSEDLDANLAIARSRLLDKVVGAELEEPFLQRLVAATDGSAAAWIFLVSWVGGLGLLILRRFLAPLRRTGTALAAALGLVVAVPSGALVATHAYVAHTVHEAVVLSPALKARELPRDGAKVTFEVHAGLKVRVLERAGGFVRIRLPNGLEGWTEGAGVADI